jgi:hypothetical protein
MNYIKKDKMDYLSATGFHSSINEYEIGQMLKSLVSKFGMSYCVINGGSIKVPVIIRCDDLTDENNIMLIRKPILDIDQACIYASHNRMIFKSSFYVACDKETFIVFEEKHINKYKGLIIKIFEYCGDPSDN